MKISGLIYCFLLISSTIANEAIKNSIQLVPIVISANYGESYTKIINNTFEYVFIYSDTNQLDGARINVESNATRDEPLMVVARQKKGILFWQVPLLVERKDSDPQPYYKTSRTLCSASLYRKEHSHLHNDNEEEYMTLSISSGSKNPVNFNVKVVKQTDFYIKPDEEERQIDISPSEPQYFGYNFTEQGDSAGSVLVKIESDTDTCMTLSVQNSTCPVFDLERTIPYSSAYWQTVSKLGGMTIPREAYPDGFFVVLAVKGDDQECSGYLGDLIRNKTIRLSIKPNITKAEGLKASVIALTIVLAFCSFYVIGVVTNNARIRRKLLRDEINYQQESEIPEQLQTPVIEEPGPSQGYCVEDDSSLDEDDIDMLHDVNSDKEIYRTKRVLAVSDLARKEPNILRHKSRLYLYYLVTIAIFYALPVVQLVKKYQTAVDETGDQDKCYYNFLCSHPFFGFSDFNHIFSNFAYVLLGMLFILLTYVREQSDLNFIEKKKSYGIPQHYGLFYAMGTALMAEGLFSASYHVCPNQSNFQFDTSFMYIIAVLCMVKIYQTRHPDINARASMTFGVLALIIFLGTVGVLNGTNTFWILFSILHVIVCLFLTAQIYYMGRWKFDRNTFRRIIMTYHHDAQASIGSILRPMYVGRFLLLLIAIFCNIALAVCGYLYHIKNEDKNFATFLLGILMFNLLLYMFFYIVMKLCYGEKILLQPMCYIILSFIVWGFALHFFLHKSVSWALTPAKSRLSNKPCKILKFFDNHDIWHFLSALAMFFSFMVLLTLDDDLEDTHRSQIPVF